MWRWIFWGLLAIVALLFALSFGAIHFSLESIVNMTLDKIQGNEEYIEQRIFFNLRAPRVFASFLTGGILACSGYLLQQLFRNPVIEPGMIGTSSGAAFGASLYIVFGYSLPWIPTEFGFFFSALVGGLLATLVVFFITGFRKHPSVLILLVTGIAVNALFTSGIAFVSYLARDPQARSITFWGLGLFSNAHWYHVLVLCTLTIIMLVGFNQAMIKLKILQIGDDNAQILGIKVFRFQVITIFSIVVLVAICTAFFGVISFVGLIIPHIVHLVFKTRYEKSVWNVWKLGCIFLVLADLLSRQIMAPIELPIGIVTSIVGVPMFISALKSKLWK
jgi:iron complex transport system permease protein